MAERCDDVYLFIGGTGMRLPAKGLGAAVFGVITAGSSVQLVAIEGMPRPTASISGTLAPAVGLGCACGSDTTPTPPLLEQAWQILRDHAATLNYAFLEPWSWWHGLIALHHHPRPWLDVIRARQRPDYSLADWIQSAVSDETVLEPFPRQILGPGHLIRLGATALPKAVELDAGRVEVTLGDPTDWSYIPGRLFGPFWSEEPPNAYIEGVRLLKPCLLSDEEGRSLYRARQI